MKEESKYYTPEIEEFHVGFEYEYKYNDKGWTQKVYEPHFEVDKIEAEKYCRVKYLDKEDIESLGFEVKKEPYRWQFGKGHINLTTAIYNSKSDVPHDRITISDGRDDHTYFDGTIKNKSELINQLKRCGI